MMILSPVAIAQRHHQLGLRLHLAYVFVPDFL